MPSTIHQILFLVVCLLAFSSYASSAASTTVNYNPWYFSERLAMYQLLLDRTTIPTLHTPSGNPLWGLPIQFDWQNESGRLPKDSPSTSHPLTSETTFQWPSDSRPHRVSRAADAPPLKKQLCTSAYVQQ
eukprot:TRINITY_DN3081_c0_g1_i3.p1 TRINITY_DN3081_c0_g1~~TRINITY_DN3081_c0_g1_i3.p1  ORF type:complete len:139 (+),score=13.10 TRINITY_DN3081_c0_g1_i3:28-417(+)